jgi:cell pole-organizing protein PopZ
MEEILASIRRIIADDQSLPSRAPREAETAREAAQPRQEPVAPDSARHDRAPFLRGTTSDGASVVYRHPAAQGDPAAESRAALESRAIESRGLESRGLESRGSEPRAEPAAKAEPQAPRIVSGPGPVGHIAAPQFAMPDLPAPRGTSVVARGVEEDTEAALLRFTAAPHGAASDAKTGGSDAKAGGTDPKLEASVESASNLFSAETDKSVASAFNRLAASRLMENDDALRGIVREMLRPLLKSWLDDNLPTMVERMVRAEIERVGRGGH